MLRGVVTNFENCTICAATDRRNYLGMKGSFFKGIVHSEIQICLYVVPNKYGLLSSVENYKKEH